MKKAALALITVGLLLLPLAYPTTVHAITILYEAADLPDNTPGEDLWQYSYYVSNYTFDTNYGFTIYFDHELYGAIEDPPPANGDADVIEWQPDAAIPDDGAFDAQSLTNGSSLAGPFTVSFVWLGNGTPGDQPFDVYDPNFDTEESGQTAQIVGMADFKVLKAKIKQNKKTNGQKGKISASFRMTSARDLNQGLAVSVGDYTEILLPPNLKDKKGKAWQYKRPKDAPKQGIKKVSIKWNKKGDIDRDALKLSIAIDEALIFAGGIPGGSPVNVDILVRNGGDQGKATIAMEQKKEGKLSHKAPKPIR